VSVLGLNIEAVESRAYTYDFRVFGMVHIRRNTAVSRFLNQQDRPYVAMTNCMVYREGYEVPPATETLLYRTDFAAIPKSRLLWLVGGMAETPNDRGAREPRQVCVMYPSYVLTGTMSTAPKVRVSDHLTQAFSDKPFVELTNVTVGKPRPGAKIEEFEVVERHELVTVNIALAGGLFDVVNPVGRAFRIEEN
jgi:hypothetical protein